MIVVSWIGKRSFFSLRLLRRILVAVSAAAGALVLASPAIAAPPGYDKDVDGVIAVTQGARIDGNVYWAGPPSIWFDITVADTASDGQCANLYLQAGRGGGWQYVGHSCGSGQRNRIQSRWNLGGAGAGFVGFGVCRDEQCRAKAVDNNSWMGD